MHRKLVEIFAIFALPAIALVYWPGLASPFLVPKAFLLLGLAAALLLLAQHSSLRDAPALATATAIWMVVLFASALRSGHREATPDAILFALAGPLVMLTTRAVLTRKARRWRAWLVVTGIIISIVVFWQAFGHLDVLHLDSAEAASRMLIAGTLGNALFAGTFLAACFVAAVAAWLESRRKLFAMSAVVIAAGIAISGSRTAIVASVVGCFVLYALRESKAIPIDSGLTPFARRDNLNETAEVRTRYGSVAQLAAIVLLLVAVALIGSLANPRSAQTAARGRIFIWNVAVADGATLLGSGPSTFAFIYPQRLSQHFAGGAHEDEYQFAGYERHAHNEWIEMLSETGIAGLLSFAAVIVIWLWTALLRSADASSIAIVGTLLAASLTDFPFHRAETWALLWMAMGASLPAVNDQSSAASQPGSRTLLVFRTAAAIVILAIASRPLIASRVLFRGERAESSGNLISAETDYRRALALQPASPEAHFNLTRTLCKQGRLEACIAQSYVAQKYVDEAELYLLRSRALTQLGRKEESAAELQRTRRRFPFSKSIPP